MSKPTAVCPLVHNLRAAQKAAKDGHRLSADTEPGWRTQMPRLLNESQVRNLLKRECDAAGGQKQWAEKHMISESYVCDALQCRRTLGRKLTEALGVKYIAMYEKQ